MNLSLLNEHKTTRVPGEPRDFIDCYLDELDKVCVFLAEHSGLQVSKTIGNVRFKIWFEPKNTCVSVCVGGGGGLQLYHKLKLILSCVP